MNPVEALDSFSAADQRGIITSDLVGIVRLTNFFRFIQKFKSHE